MKLSPKPGQETARKKPNIGTKYPGKRNSLVKSQHKLEMARRRSRVAELASEGKSVRAAEDILRSEGFTHCDQLPLQHRRGFRRILEDERDIWAIMKHYEPAVWVQK